MRDVLQTILIEQAGSSVVIKTLTTVSGGDINDAYKIDTNRGSFFIKLNSLKYPELFNKEAEGLNLLITGDVRVPEIIDTGILNNLQYLLLEYIVQGNSTKNTHLSFGGNLAKLHAHSNPYFGLDSENYIGSLIQSNTLTEKWHDFYHNQRLLPLTESAVRLNLLNEEDLDNIQKLGENLHNIIPEEPPALLHGDLWSGNYLVDENAEAVLIDPSVYFGHREMDIAMTKLFGGFTNDFYTGYNRTRPLEKDWEQRIPLFQLYPLLVHINLFGSSYTGSFRNALGKYL